MDFGNEIKLLFENFDHRFTTRNYKGTVLRADWILSDCSDVLQLSLFPAPATGHPLRQSTCSILWIWGPHGLQSLLLSDNSHILMTEKWEFHSNRKRRSCKFFSDRQQPLILVARFRQKKVGKKLLKAILPFFNNFPHLDTWTFTAIHVCS